MKRRMVSTIMKSWIFSVVTLMNFPLLAAQYASSIVWARGLLVFCLAVFVAGVAMAPRLKRSALTTLEVALQHRFSRTKLQDHDQIAGIIVLGGEPLRIQEAATLAAKFPRANVILSGADKDEEAFASATPALAGRLVMDRRPKNTFENAVFCKELAKARPGERWILVTSALHMPRAIGAFRAVGFMVEPWPVADRTTLEGEREVRLFHEIAGLLAYRILGRSQA